MLRQGREGALLAVGKMSNDCSRTDLATADTILQKSSGRNQHTRRHANEMLQNRHQSLNTQWLCVKTSCTPPKRWCLFGVTFKSSHKGSNFQRRLERLELRRCCAPANPGTTMKPNEFPKIDYIVPFQSNSTRNPTTAF